MSTIQFELEQDLIELLHDEKQPLESSVREFLIIEMYRRHMISRGKAAQLLAMPLLDFIQLASRLGIAFIEMSDEEWREELAAIL